MPPEDADPAAKCPVDHKTREKWLEAAKAKGQQLPHPPTTTTPPTSPSQSTGWLWKAKPPVVDEMPLQLKSVSNEESIKNLLARHQQHDLHPLQRTSQARFSLDRMQWIATSHPSPPPQPPKRARHSLPTDREISSIPRAMPTNHDRQAPNTAEAAAMPANSELDTGHDRTTGHWIYPSQEMFFAAMARKGHSPLAADMSTIVPIHNAVNERAWRDILAWEKGRGSEKCGGPKLVSFSGDSKALTPRARWKGLMGYQAPFDRHDWVVDRCGKRVEYVIDFYAGKDEGMVGKGLNFYLDVRPKMNSWEGISTRAARAVGL